MSEMLDKTVTEFLRHNDRAINEYKELKHLNNLYLFNRKKWQEFEDIHAIVSIDDESLITAIRNKKTKIYEILKKRFQEILIDDLFYYILESTTDVKEE